MIWTKGFKISLYKKKEITVNRELGIQYDGAIWSAAQLESTLVGLAPILDTTSETVAKLSMTYCAVFFSSVKEPSAWNYKKKINLIIECFI